MQICREVKAHVGPDWRQSREFAQVAMPMPPAAAAALAMPAPAPAPPPSWCQVSATIDARDPCGTWLQSRVIDVIKTPSVLVCVRITSQYPLPFPSEFHIWVPLDRTASLGTHTGK